MTPLMTKVDALQIALARIEQLIVPIPDNLVADLAAISHSLAVEIRTMQVAPIAVADLCDIAEHLVETAEQTPRGCLIDATIFADMVGLQTVLAMMQKNGAEQ